MKWVRSCLSCWGALFYLISLAPLGFAQFETRATQATFGDAFGIVAADFRGNGKLDVAVMDNSLSVLLGNGDGTFQSPVDYGGIGSFSLAVGDFNGDGRPDIVTANGDNSVSVYLGNGDGTFQAAKTSPTTDDCSFVAVGNFNGDRNLDIVIIDGPYVSVLLGNGDGTFQAPIDNDSFLGAQWLAVGDFNNDHRADVAAAGFFGGSQNVGVLLGNGDGTLQSSLNYPLVHAPYSIALADLNHDGDLDAVVGDTFGYLTVLLGDGSGGFKTEEDYPATGGYAQVAVADFNGDGNPDVAFVSSPLPSGVNVFLGNGDGTLQPAQFYKAGSLDWGVAVGDFNGDKQPDMVLSDRESMIVTLLNTGVVSFSPTTPLTFAPQALGTAGTQELSLTNNGLEALSIRSVSTSKPFSSHNGCGATVAPGATCSITLQFKPQKIGTASGLLTVTDGASSKPQVVEISGGGTPVLLAPAALDFGDQAVGTKSPPQKIMVTNVSNDVVSFSSINLAGADAKDFNETNTCGAQLLPNASCTVSVTFSPTRSGTRTADVYVGLSGTVSPAEVPLSGIGT